MRYFLTLFLVVVLFVSGCKTFVSAPINFPAPYDLNITTGESLATISHQLVNDHVIRSSRVFSLFMEAFGSDKTISQGEYYFKTPSSALTIAMRISGKEFGITDKKITFPEGYTTIQMATHLGEVFPNFNTIEFLALTKDAQGYLFPDTYRFFPSVTPELVIAAMKTNYQEKLTPLRADIAASGHTESQIIIMASIIEKEAKGTSDSPTIAGILWKRIESGIALQVDADPKTYMTKGLPATPLDNPGLVAIEAAIHPVSSPYLYYLHDASGTIHYASTYQQHQQNIAKYLK
jgi:UPF0755 protein